jgi:hypothetical protein
MGLTYYLNMMPVGVHITTRFLEGRMKKGGKLTALALLLVLAAGAAFAGGGGGIRNR